MKKEDILRSPFKNKNTQYYEKMKDRKKIPTLSNF